MYIIIDLPACPISGRVLSRLVVVVSQGWRVCVRVTCRRAAVVKYANRPQPRRALAPFLFEKKFKTTL